MVIRSLLLALFLLLAQAGALAHGITHPHDQTGGDEPVCEQCLAFAPMGTGVASTTPTWALPTQAIAFEVAIAAASPTSFRPTYHSRAPPESVQVII